MTANKQYTAAVDVGLFPETTSVPLDDSFKDERGEITNLLLTPITSVARITSRKRDTRANHYHRTDWHYAFVESGCVLYFERAIGDDKIPEPKTYGPGSMFFTPPNREHCMLFAEDSVIFTFAKNVRDHETHEADLVRVSIITPELAARFVP